MNDLIVEASIVCVTDKGDRHPMIVEVGRPYPVAEDFACHVAIRGLHDHIAPIMGSDQMQALTLALSIVKANLEVLEKKGYKIVFPDDSEEDTSVTEIWFSGLGTTEDPNKEPEATR